MGSDPTEGVGTVHAEAARDIPLSKAEHEAGVPAPTERQQAAVQRPSVGAAPGHPSRADHEVGIAGGIQQGRQLLGEVGTVGVHADELVEPASEAPLEAREVGGGQPRLGRTVQHVHRGIREGERVGDLAGAVG